MESILQTIENSSLNVSEIAKFHKVSKDEVVKVLIDNEYYSFKENSNARLPSAKRLKKAAKLFIETGCENTTITKVAEEVGLRKTALKKYLETYYPEISLSRVQFNEQAFDTIDTEEKAYWLGFMYADGSLSSSTSTVELQLSSKDKEHLRKFSRFMRYNGEIKTKVNKKDKNENVYYESCRVYFSNKHLWNSLNEKGCTPRKSLTLQFPNESIFKDKSLIRHFIRGYFDGDGSLGIYDNKVDGYVYHNHCSMYFLGTKDILTHIAKYIGIPKEVCLRSSGPKTKNDIYILQYSTKEAFFATFYMYHNANVYLDRKYVKYMEYCRLYEESYRELQTNIGEGCDVNPEISTETKESVPSYSVDGETYIWKPMQLFESGCYSCEIPKDEHGNCKCPKSPCSNCAGYYVRI